MAKRTGRKRRTKKIKLARVTITEIEVENPHFQKEHDISRSNPTHIKATYNPKESYVGYLWQKKNITDAEKWAGDRVRQAYEAMGGSGAPAMDYTRLKVDGGGSSDPITERQLKAASILLESSRALGPEGHDLVIVLAGEGLWPKDLTLDKEKRRFMSMRFRECLETLAVYWGKQGRQERRA